MIVQGVTWSVPMTTAADLVALITVKVDSQCATVTVQYFLSDAKQGTGSDGLNVIMRPLARTSSVTESEKAGMCHTVTTYVERRLTIETIGCKAEAYV